MNDANPSHEDLAHALYMADGAPTLAQDIAAELDVIRVALSDEDNRGMVDYQTVVASLQRRAELLAKMLGADVHENFASPETVQADEGGAL